MIFKPVFTCILNVINLLFRFQASNKQGQIKILFTEKKTNHKNCPISNNQPVKRIALRAFEIRDIILEYNYHVIWIQLCTDCAPCTVRSEAAYRCKRHLQSTQLLTCSS
jgi:hypothetical protein